MIFTFLENFVLAFLLSLTHCFFMCGAVVFLLSKNTNKIQIYVYNFFRILIYVILGLIAFSIGSFFTSVFLQSLLYFLIGIFCVLIGIALIVRGKLLAFFENNFLYTKIISLFNSIMRFKAKSVIIGCANGLFPCGLVYFFIAKTMLAKNINEALIIIISFALATLPAMIFTSFLPKYLEKIRYLQNFFYSLIVIDGIYFCYLALRLSKNVWWIQKGYWKYKYRFKNRY